MLDRLLAAAGEALAHGSAASAVALAERARSRAAASRRVAEVLGLLGMADCWRAGPRDGRTSPRRRRSSTDPGARAGLALAGARFQLIAGEAREAVALLRSALDGEGG